MAKKHIIEIDADKDGAFLRINGKPVAELPDEVELRVDVRALKLYGRKTEPGEHKLDFPYTIIIDRDEDGMFADINGREFAAPNIAAVLDLLREMFLPLGSPPGTGYARTGLRAAMQAAFEASPEELGEAAVEAAARDQAKSDLAALARDAIAVEIEPEMKPEYDFSKGVRGKFHRPDAEPPDTSWRGRIEALKALRPCDHPQTMTVTGCKGCPFFRINHHAEIEQVDEFSCVAAGRSMSRDPQDKAPPAWCPLTNDVVLVKIQVPR